MKQPECEDKALLVAWLYGECDQEERDLMEAHLAACEACAVEVEGLRGTRAALCEWAPPEPALGFRVVREEVNRPRWAWPRVPVWAQAAAAVLVLAAGAAIANLDVTLARRGVTIRTGWSQPAPPPAGTTPSGDVTRDELAALRQELLGRITAVSKPAGGSLMTAAVAPAPVAAGTDWTQGVSKLIDESERRQKSEFERQIAQRFVEFQRDVSAQQRMEFVRLQRGLVQFQGRTSVDIAQLRQVQGQVQTYLLRTAQVQEVK
jgi:hypothetical protein